MNDNSRGQEGDEAAQEKGISKLVSEHGWDDKSVRLGIRAHFRCEYCGRYLLRSVDDYDAWQIDHIAPKSGDVDVDDDCDNLAIACKTCNFMKRDWKPDPSALSTGSREEKIQVIGAHVLELRKKKEVRLQQIRHLARCLEGYCATEE